MFDPTKIPPGDSMDILVFYSVPQVQEKSIKKSLFYGDIDFPCDSSTKCPQYVPRVSVVTKGNGWEQDTLAILVAVEDTDNKKTTFIMDIDLTTYNDNIYNINNDNIVNEIASTKTHIDIGTHGNC